MCVRGRESFCICTFLQKPCIISFSLSCPKDELETASFDFLAFDMAASHHQWLDETRAAALRGSSLTPSLSLSPLLRSLLLCLLFLPAAVLLFMHWAGKSDSYDCARGAPCRGQHYRCDTVKMNQNGLSHTSVL